MDENHRELVRKWLIKAKGEPDPVFVLVQMWQLRSFALFYFEKGRRC